MRVGTKLVYIQTVVFALDEFVKSIHRVNISYHIKSISIDHGYVISHVLIPSIQQKIRS